MMGMILERQGKRICAKQRTKRYWRLTRGREPRQTTWRGCLPSRVRTWTKRYASRRAPWLSPLKRRRL